MNYQFAIDALFGAAFVVVVVVLFRTFRAFRSAVERLFDEASDDRF